MVRRIPGALWVLSVMSVVAVVGGLAAIVSARTWTVAHLPDGQPDMQGYWTNATFKIGRAHV